MPRAADPAVRDRLVERAAALLTTEGDVSLRRVATAAGTSTMAVYTHFDGMPGLWRAVRERAFDRLAERLDGVIATNDPVADLVAAGAAYVTNALDHPSLYLVMFDIRRGTEQPDGAASTFLVLIGAVQRATDGGRLARDVDAMAAAIQLWGMTHGMVMLVLTGALPLDSLRTHLPEMLVSALVGMGDDPALTAASVAAGFVVTSEAERHARPGLSGLPPGSGPGPG